MKYYIVLICAAIAAILSFFLPKWLGIENTGLYIVTVMFCFGIILVCTIILLMLMAVGDSAREDCECE